MNISSLKINKEEVLRYLGYSGKKPDEETDRCIDEMILLADSVLSPKEIHGIFDTENCPDGIKLKGTDTVFGGNDIENHLDGSFRCILFAATLGAEAERQLNILQKKDMQKAVIFDAVCDTYIEEFSDVCCKKLKEEMRKNGLYINTRFSPGYGDLSIERQTDIISVLNCTKLIGLTVTDSFILLPRKSITALIGVFKNPPKGTARGCESCNMKDKCKMRGDGKCSNQTDSI